VSQTKLENDCAFLAPSSFFLPAKLYAGVMKLQQTAKFDVF